MTRAYRIGVVAPGGRMAPEVVERVAARAAAVWGGAVEIVFHPQCLLSSGHFAGDDETRARAFLEVANDPAFDALWFGRGGYGACRIAEAVDAGLAPAAADKAYLGYSDAGFLLALLHRRGFAHVFHGPMATDVLREGGERAVDRALAWLVRRDPAALEAALRPGRPALCFNLTVLSQTLGTPLEPDVTGCELILEEVSEHMYRIDRHLFHVTANASVRRAAGLRLGRCSLIPENDPDFGRTEEEIAREWCARSGVPWLGRADVGHDADNKVVPFGRPAARLDARPAEDQAARLEGGEPR